LSLDILDDLLFTEPLRQLASHVFHIEILVHILIFINCLIVVAALSHHAHSLLADLVIDVVLFVLELIIDEGSGSSTLHSLSLELLSIKLHVDIPSFVHIQLDHIIVIVDSSLLVVIELRSLLVIVFHTVEEIVSFDLFFRLVLVHVVFLSVVVISLDHIVFLTHSARIGAIKEKDGSMLWAFENTYLKRIPSSLFCTLLKGLLRELFGSAPVLLLFMSGKVLFCLVFKN
jgi:hypothetical protein